MDMKLLGVGWKGHRHIKTGLGLAAGSAAAAVHVLRALPASPSELAPRVAHAARLWRNDPGRKAWAAAPAACAMAGAIKGVAFASLRSAAQLPTHPTHHIITVKKKTVYPPPHMDV